MTDTLAPLKMTQPQYATMAALAYLSSTGAAVRQQTIADQLGMDKVMASEILRRLEAKGWVVRDAHPEDGRAVRLSLNASGRAVLAKAVPLVESLDDVFFRSVGERDYRSLVGTLQRLTTRMS